MIELNADLEALKDRYEIVTELGQGGMSVVYKARDKTLDRLVALKTLSVKSLSERQLIQFQAEARALSGLKHKGIMEILDFGITRTGKPYMVLEYIEGIPLSKYIENVGPMPLILCFSIFCDLCEALSHAHNKGVLHRDIKPSNIILVSAGKDGYSPKIIDFGLAVLGDTQTSTEVEIEAAGSPPYMSPEQIEGKDLDQRSDVYSLGCTLFEALTGRIPYEGASALETMNMHKTAPLPVLGKVCDDPNINYPLQNCVHKAIAKKKNDRYQFMIAFQKVLDELKTQALESARLRKQVDKLEDRLTKPKKKLPVVWIVSALSSTVLLILAYFLVSSEYSKKVKKEDSVQIEAQKFQDERTKESVTTIHDDLHRHDGSVDVTQKSLDAIPISETNVTYRNGAVLDGNFSTLKRLKKLKKLTLSATGVKPENIEQISHLVTLEELYLPANEKIAQADFAPLAKLKNLKCLNLEGCNLNKDALLVISSMKSLEELNIRMEAGLNKEVMGNLQKLPNLVHLEIGGNPKMDLETKQAIGNFSKVKYLGLDGLLLDDDTAEIISKNLKGIEKLNFTHNLITLSGLEALLKAPSLQWINVNGCDQILNEESEDSLAILSKKYQNVKIVDVSRFIRKSYDEYK
ncbi:MAG: protein kinase [Candidatus Melainabacteria bacterium]|nr:protein kinase [Candidatus Melainabacteria bacterium]